MSVAHKNMVDALPLDEPAPQRRPNPQITADILAIIPNLRAFAVSLCGNIDHADDLVQEALVKAWTNKDTFVEGTNLRAWLFTILRNIYYSEYRKRRREVADPDGTFAANLATAPAVPSRIVLEFADASPGDMMVSDQAARSRS